MSICPFKKYKNIFGKTGEDAHYYRFMNVAIVDYGMSILFAIFLTYFTNVPLVLTTIGILILGIVLHILFGVNTNAVKYLGLVC